MGSRPGAPSANRWNRMTRRSRPGAAAPAVRLTWWLMRDEHCGSGDLCWVGPETRAAGVFGVWFGSLSPATGLRPTTAFGWRAERAAALTGVGAERHASHVRRQRTVRMHSPTRADRCRARDARPNRATRGRLRGATRQSAPCADTAGRWRRPHRGGHRRRQPLCSPAPKQRECLQ